MCVECPAGRYGAECESECGCPGQAVCDDGIEGTGACTCPEGFFGADCADACGCENEGACDDGFEGTGACTCEPGTYGESCAGTCTCGTGTCNDGATGDGQCACEAPELTCGLSCSAPVADAENPIGEFSTSTDVFGQSFVPLSDGRLVSFTFTTGGLVDTYTVTLREGAGLFGPELASEVNDSGEAGETTIVFADAPTVSAGSSYTVVISSESGLNHILQIDDPYADGQYFFPEGESPIFDLMFSTTLAPCP